MEDGINKLITFLDNAKNNDRELTFIITIPIWDKLGKRLMKFKYPEKSRLPVIEYEDFNAINSDFSVIIPLINHEFILIEAKSRAFSNGSIVGRGPSHLEKTRETD